MLVNNAAGLTGTFVRLTVRKSRFYIGHSFAAVSKRYIFRGMFTTPPPLAAI